MASGSQGKSSNKQDAKDTEYTQYVELYRAADNGDLESVNKFLELHPNALTASLSVAEDRALHVAVLAGRDKVVEELVRRLDPQDLLIENIVKTTALNYAAMGGDTKIAEHLVRRNPQLLIVPNNVGQIPVVVASFFGHEDMVRYLYSVTPKEVLDPKKGNNGAKLFTNCITADIYDIPMELLGLYSDLAYYVQDGKTAMDFLAEKPSAFPSGTQLAFWQQWIYSRIYVHEPCAHNKNRGDIEGPCEGPAEHQNFITSALNQLFDRMRKSLIFSVPTIVQIYELKLTHVQSQELLSRICREISTQRKEQWGRVRTVLFKAVKHGIVEFVTELMKYYPDIVWCRDENNFNIFLVATLQRQEKIFRLVYTMGAKKNGLASHLDAGLNNILHQAAYLAPPSQLDRVSGAALQMQRELQWFKAVESILPPAYKELKNNRGQSPQALFTDEHKKLLEEGKKWMKETAESCTVVAALIATIVFAAAFTVPGGYNDLTGIPRYLHRNSFMVFMISDALSFFFSCSSVLMFMEIHTSRYRENDFLISLPRYLIIGLSSLILSIATMMVTFAASLVIVLRERISWVAFPIVLIASLPVTLLALPKFPLLVEIFNSTYGPGIFKKPKKPAAID